MLVQIGEDMAYWSLTSGSQQIKELVLILNQQFSSFNPSWEPILAMVLENKKTYQMNPGDLMN